jgi:hypothetical protein
MIEKLCWLRRVKPTQLQPDGLIIETPYGNLDHGIQRVAIDNM